MESQKRLTLLLSTWRGGIVLDNVTTRFWFDAVSHD